jgi:hypothetical protein
MKYIKSAFFALVLAASAPVFADDHAVVNRPSGADFLYDIVLRPAGFVATIIGGGLYLALSPATAITSLQPPHDTFKTFADFIIMNPYKFTFTRPVGDYNFPQTEK